MGGRLASHALAVLVFLLLAAPATGQLPALPPAPAVPYHSYDALTAEMEALAEAHPELARLHGIGESRLGREVWALEIADFRAPGADLLPSLVVVAGQRGDAPASAEAAWLWARDLVEGSPDAALLQRLRVWVVPLANPDGHELGLRGNAGLVDLERNFPFHWAERGAGALGTPAYPGPRAASEPETRALMALLAAQRPAAYVAIDDGAPALLRPFGHAPTQPVPDEALYGALATWARSEAGLEARAPEASGGSVDWAYGSQALFSAGLTLAAPSPGVAGEAALRAAAAPPFAVLGHLLGTFHRWGAHLEATLAKTGPERAALTITNTGLAPARGIAVAATGLTLLEPLPPELAPGATATATARLDPPAQARLTYQRLLVAAEEPSLALGEADADLLLSATSIEPKEAPGPGDLLLLAGLVAAALVARRLRG